MQQPQPKYKFYATLLDAFKWYQVSEREDAEQELLDKINRIPVTDEQAVKRMSRGTALNNAVDRYLSTGHIVESNEMVLETVNGVDFEFEPSLINELCSRLDGAIQQYYVSTIIVVDGIPVELYGYVDYIRMNTIIDLKGTSAYDLGKYKDSLQRHVYPVALSHKGVMDADVFEFLVTDYKEVYSETYPVNIEASKAELVNVCRDLIEFIEFKRELITDTKIFGGEITTTLYTPIDNGVMVEGIN